MLLSTLTSFGLLLAGCDNAPVGGSVSPPATAVSVAAGTVTSTTPSRTRSSVVPTSTTSPTSTLSTGTPGVPPSADLLPGFITPEGAIRAWMAKQGYAYAGDCRTTHLEKDVGKYCSSLFERQVGQRVYVTGPTFSEFTTYLLVTQSSSGWRVTATAKDDGTSPPPW